jgi:hypothetical protein
VAYYVTGVTRDSAGVDLRPKKSNPKKQLSACPFPVREWSSWMHAYAVEYLVVRDGCMGLGTSCILKGWEVYNCGLHQSTLAFVDAFDRMTVRKIAI